MKKLSSLVLLFFVMLLLSACTDQEDPLNGEAQASITITFETNSDMRLHPLTYERGESIDLPALTSIGSYLFKGWYLDEDLIIEASNLENREEDFTLYAKWEIEPFEMLIDVYTEVRVKHLFMNEIAMFIIDDLGDLYIQANTQNPYFSSNELSGDMSDIPEGASGGGFTDPDGGNTDTYAWSLNAFIVQSNGNVYAWGDNTYGQLGTGDKMSSGQFVDITDQFDLQPDETIIKMVGNGKTTFALTSHGNLYAWGANEYNMIGENEATERLNPTNVKDFWCGTTDHFLVDNGLCGETDHLIVDIVVTNENVLILTNFHQLFLWGADAKDWFDEIELTSENMTEAVYMYLTGHVTNMVASSDTIVLVSERNEILIIGKSKLGAKDHAWGGGPVRMALGDYLDLDSDGDSILDIDEAYLAGDTLLLQLSDGTLWGLGDNTSNLISHKKGYDYYQALSEIVTNFTPQSIAMSSQEVCALDDDSYLWCWGSSSPKNLSHNNEMILSTDYRSVTYEGNTIDDTTVWERTTDESVTSEASTGPIRWMAPESIIAAPFSQPYRLYTVTRYHVTAIPPTIVGLEVTSPAIDGVGNEHPNLLELVLSDLMSDRCRIDNYADACRPPYVTFDPIIHPGAWHYYNTSEGLIRWAFELSFRGARAGTTTATYSGDLS